MTRKRLALARGQNPPGIRTATHPLWPLRFTRPRCKVYITLCNVCYTFCHSKAALCVAPRANSAAIPPSSRLASPGALARSRVLGRPYPRTARRAWRPGGDRRLGRLRSGPPDIGVAARRAKSPDGDELAHSLVAGWIEALGGNGGPTGSWTSASFTLTTEMWGPGELAASAAPAPATSPSRAWRPGEAARVERWEGDDFIRHGFDGVSPWAVVNGRRGRRPRRQGLRRGALRGRRRLLLDRAALQAGRTPGSLPPLRRPRRRGPPPGARHLRRGGGRPQRHLVLRLRGEPRDAGLDRLPGGGARRTSAAPTGRISGKSTTTPSRGGAYTSTPRGRVRKVLVTTDFVLNPDIDPAVFKGP